ncbi:MAG TPA: hypothetical protein PKJ03_06655 [Methanoregulaceae archaeon]|nr:hypothetical protein [Methanoregulaceae archaeon]
MISSSANAIGLVPFSYQPSVAPLADVHLLFLASKYRCPLVTDTTATELHCGPDKLMVIQEAGERNDSFWS